LTEGTSGTLAPVEDLIKAGLTYEIKVNSILLKNARNETVAIIFNNKLTPVKWKPYYEFPSRIETSEGYWILKDGNEVYFDLGFKEGRTIEAKEVNDYLVNSDRAQKEGQPYLNGSIVIERILQPGEKFYVIEYKIQQSQPGGWATTNRITTVQELRDELAVLQEWKDETLDRLVIREYEVIKPVRIRDGKIGPQLEKTGPNSGKIYKGGGHQYEFIEKKFTVTNPYTNFLKKLSEEILK
jgi:hypothetical protein